MPREIVPGDAFKIVAGCDKQFETCKSKFANQVKKNAKSDWASFQFSRDLWRRIEQIAYYSRIHDLNLVFVIPPTIVEMQQRIVDFGFGELNHDFREKLAQLAPVIDLDYPNIITANLESFTDAYHFNARISKQIVGEIVQVIHNDDKDLSKARYQ